MIFGDARSPDLIITQHIGKLGLLGDNLPERVATFYTRMQAIRSDWARVTAADLDGKPAQKALIVEANWRLWKHTAEQATVLLKDLKTLATRKHWISFDWWFK
jgi:hypothetical protein